MRKLTVKNFSVIKEAELEFGKITVLIGPQSSGKSLLCKLAYFLGREAITIAIGRAVQRFEYGFEDVVSAVSLEFLKWFPRNGWGSEDWSVVFSENEYQVTVSGSLTTDSDSGARVTFSQTFKSAYEARTKATIDHRNNGGFLIEPALQSLAATEFLKPSRRGIWDSSTYIPVERSYFVDATKGYNLLGSESDPILAAFGSTYTLSLKIASQGKRIPKFLKGILVSWQNGWMLDFQDGRFLPLSQLSSGSKETLPMVSILDYYEHQRRQSGNLASQELYGNKLYVFDDFTIEEPEASVFPETQYELMRELAGLANEINFHPNFAITTHSPYILTAFNTLIEAWRVGSKEGKREQVASVVPEQYWINENDFAAYAIHDGVLVSIFEPEQEGKEGSGLIDGDYLDRVSDQLGGKFEKLLDIEYAN
jgi:hypothetical protein